MRKYLGNIISIYLQNLLVRSIDSYVNDLEKLFIIQLGANDGITIDPIQRWVKLPKTEAILVEPVPYLVEKLQLLYEGSPNIKIVKAAIAVSSTDKTIPFYYFKPREGIEFRDYYSLLGSFSYEHVEKHRSIVPDFKNLLVKEALPCISLERLYAEAGIAKLNILQMDIEGIDYEIIMQIDFKIIKPEILIFEHKHMTKEQIRIILNWLEKEGYLSFSLGDNTTSISNYVVKYFYFLKSIKGLRKTLLIPHGV